MKKIVFMINALSIGGAQRLVVDDINECLRRGFEVFLVTLEPERDESLRGDCQLDERRWRKIYFRNSHDFKGWKNLLAFLKMEKPDVVITHLWFANNVGRVSAFLSGVKKVLAFEHSVYDKVKSRKQFFIDWVLQYASTKVISVSSSVRKSLLRHGIDSRRIAVIPNGLELGKFKNPQCDSTDKLPLPQSFIFVFIGRLITAKALDVLIKALSLVPKGFLLVVGDGPERGKLEALAYAQGVLNRMLFTGSRSDIACILKRSDCLVLPSRREGFGLVLLEAMASSVPVIASDFKAAQEIIEDHTTGLLVTAENPSTLAESMQEIMENKELRTELVKNGIKRVNDFSIGRHIESMLDYIK